MRTFLRYSVLLATAMVIQRGLLSQFRIDDVSVDAFMVLAVATGIVAGVERGAMVGFASGCALDVFVITPFGLGAISYLLAGVLAGSLEGRVVHSARWLTMTVAFLSSALSLIFLAVLASVIGQTGYLDGHLLVVILVVSSTTAVLVLPVRRACVWAEVDLPTRAAIH